MPGPSEHHRAALDEQLLADLGTELQPAQPGLAAPAGVELVGSVAGAQDAVVAGGGRARMAGLVGVDQRHLEAAPPQRKGGGGAGDPRPDHDRVADGRHQLSGGMGTRILSGDGIRYTNLMRRMEVRF